MHGFEQSISIKIPPMSTLIFSTPAKRAPRGSVKKEKTEAAKKPAVRTSAPKKKSAKAAEKTGKQAK